MPHTLAQIPSTWAGDLVVAGSDVSTILRQKVAKSAVPTVPTAAGTTEVLLISSVAGTISAVRAAFKDALAASDTNFVTFNLINKGQAGAGSANTLATTPAGVNTSKVTGGAAQVAYAARAMTLNAANLVVAVGDVLAFQVVGTGTLANTLTEGTIQVVFDAVG